MNAPPADNRFPFDQGYQQALLRLLCEDDSFGLAAAKYIQPTFFENTVLAWAWSYVLRYIEKYGTTPHPRVLVHEARRLDPSVAPLYAALLEQVQTTPLGDEQWLRDSTLEFIKRNIFVESFQETRNLYNSGKTEESYRYMADRLDEIHQVKWANPDRSWFFEELHKREGERMHRAAGQDCIPTLMGPLDNVLEGGAHKGGVYIWIAYNKVGKTTFLMHHGAKASTILGRKVLHIPLEGGRAYLENRYDTAISGELYSKVKFGKLSGEEYVRLRKRYEEYRHNLVIRGFAHSEDWDTNITHIYSEIRDLEKHFGWKPDLVIIDYGDLLSGRKGSYKNTYEEQKSTFRDMDNLANRGYAVWTATQAQRMEKGADETPHLVKHHQVADCIEKVRVAWFVGSINRTNAEKTQNQARLFAELYRDNEAGIWFPVYADYSRMDIRFEPSLMEAANPSPVISQPLGYEMRVPTS